MTQPTHPHRFAGAAIAAVLALGSTPLWAQETAPGAEAPASIPAPVQQPTLVLPDVSGTPAAPVVIAPIAKPVVAAATIERAAPRAAAPVARAAPAPVVRRQIAPVDTIVAGPVETPVAATPVEPLTTIETPIEEPLVQETAVAAPADSTTGNVLPIAGLLAALGLGGIALFAARRRRRQPDEIAPAIVAHEPAPALPPRFATAAPTQMPAPNFVAPALSLQQFAQPTSVQTARPVWQEPRYTVAAPASTQASQLNRQALLERMVAARPDANNPFKTRKVRRRRARQMLQAMDSGRWDDTELAPGFDWREQARATRELETVSA